MAKIAAHVARIVGSGEDPSDDVFLLARYRAQVDALLEGGHDITSAVCVARRTRKDSGREAVRDHVGYVVAIDYAGRVAEQVGDHEKWADNCLEKYDTFGGMALSVATHLTV